MGKNLYYALNYPFLIYRIIKWGNTSESTLKPILILQKQLVRIITCAQFDSHSSPLFKSLQRTKFFGLAAFHIAIFMYKFHNQLIPTFHSYFSRVTNVHSYSTSFAAKQSYYTPYARTNYGKFNVRFKGPSIWNTIENGMKMSSMATFKKKLKQQYMDKY